MLMNLMAAGCFVIVAGVMIAMWRFDARNEEENRKAYLNKMEQDIIRGDRRGTKKK